jgi:hypothetical protein
VAAQVVEVEILIPLNMIQMRVWKQAFFIAIIVVTVSQPHQLIPAAAANQVEVVILTEIILQIHLVKITPAA